MKFELLPTVDVMLGIYKMPLSMERFNAYIKILQGNTKDDLVMPVGGFNPMAKDHAIQKLEELKALQAEAIIQKTLSAINTKFSNHKNPGVFRVALNLSDDLHGGWTNRYTSDYDSKFKINALVNRKFCTPIFWTSENFTAELIEERTLEYVYRTVYWQSNPKPKTLEDHIVQEKFVAENIGRKSSTKINTESLESFYKKHHQSEEYHIIFNFLYGDAASKSLEFPTHGIIEEMAGFKYSGQ